MAVIAHLSDLHFGTEEPAVLAALAQDVIAARPDLVVVSGDLTQRARHRQFRAARAWLVSLGPPWLAVPGNHDLPLWAWWRRLGSPWDRWRRHFGHAQIALHLAPALAVVGLATPRGTLWKGGRLAAAQLARAAACFATAPTDRVRVLVVHHPLVAGAITDGERVRGAARALAALLAAEVDLVLAGHHHRSWSGGAGARRGAGGRGLVVVHAGTAVSHRTRDEANAWNLITADRGRLAIEIRGFADGGFAALARRTFARGRDGWREA